MNIFDHKKISFIERIIRTIPVRFKIINIHIKSTLVSPIFIYNGGGVKIEKGVTIYPGSRIETHNGGTITIKENANIGQNFHIISCKLELCIERNCTISGNVFISNLDHNYKEIGKHILDQQNIISKTHIGENCFIGYGAVIQPGTILGNHCVVGSNAVLRGNFPDYCVIAGSPAKIIKRYSFDKKEWLKTDDKGNFIQI
ncbi:acyltransferase [Chryseobacterium binzhouense]|uniref:acyltransferase n=1 Tax=Chryseobacterium binzhouense TaxID=2593646 RepID=UPI00117ECC64|nr:acyltransferase [Chryseobacterium binzhouense]